ncbi:hypothetical protein HYD50_01115 [Mycoplasmopsis bovis]|nr:hypothetical protein [Mycoplasmopsis bovis]QQH72494.1 hypothetical protein HYD50_01115 [Mycoplasmopsis bovis]
MKLKTDAEPFRSDYINYLSKMVMHGMYIRLNWPKKYYDSVATMGALISQRPL